MRFSRLRSTCCGLCIFLLYKIVRGDQPAASDSGDDEPPRCPALAATAPCRAAALRLGVQDPRILMAINGKVFDVTKAASSTGLVRRLAGEPQRQEGAPAPGWVLESARRRRGARGGLEWCPGLGGRGREAPGRAGGQRHPGKAAGKPVGSQIPSPHSPTPAWGGGRRLKCKLGVDEG